MGFLSKVFKSITKPFKKVFKGIKSVFKKVGKFMGKIGVVGSIAMMFLVPYAMGALGTMFGNMAQLQGAFAGLQGTGLGSIVQGAGKFLNGVYNVGTGVKNVLGQIGTTITNAVGRTAGKLLNQVGFDNVFGYDLNKLGSWDEIWKKTQEEFTDIGTVTVDSFSKVARGQMNDAFKESQLRKIVDEDFAEYYKEAKYQELEGVVNQNVPKGLLDKPYGEGYDKAGFAEDILEMEVPVAPVGTDQELLLKPTEAGSLRERAIKNIEGRLTKDKVTDAAIGAVGSTAMQYAQGGFDQQQIGSVGYVPDVMPIFNEGQIGYAPATEQRIADGGLFTDYYSRYNQQLISPWAQSSANQYINPPGYTA